MNFSLVKKHNLYNFIVAIILSIIFAAALPLDVEDINNYLNRVELINSGNYNLGLFFIWDNFFLLTYNIVGESFLIFSIRFILYLLLILSSFKELNRGFYVLIILFSPLIIDHFLGGLRQGLAFVIFITAYYFPHRYTRVILFCVTVFIHPLSIWWIATYVFAFIAFKADSKLLLIGFSILCFFIVKIIFQIPFVASFLMYGDRYELGESGRSIFGLIFWLIILVLSLLIKDRKFDNYMIIFSLLQLVILYNNFESVYRFFQSILPIFIIYNINNMKNYLSRGIILFYIIFVFVHYFSYYQKLFP